MALAFLFPKSRKRLYFSTMMTSRKGGPAAEQSKRPASHKFALLGNFVRSAHSKDINAAFVPSKGIRFPCPNFPLPNFNALAAINYKNINLKGCFLVTYYYLNSKLQKAKNSMVVNQCKLQKRSLGMMVVGLLQEPHASFPHVRDIAMVRNKISRVVTFLTLQRK